MARSSTRKLPPAIIERGLSGAPVPRLVLDTSGQTAAICYCSVTSRQPALGRYTTGGGNRAAAAPKTAHPIPGLPSRRLIRQERRPGSPAYHRRSTGKPSKGHAFWLPQLKLARPHNLERLRERYSDASECQVGAVPLPRRFGPADLRARLQVRLRANLRADQTSGATVKRSARGGRTEGRNQANDERPRRPGIP